MSVAMKDVFETIDSQDATGFADHFTAEGVFRFGNAPAVVGRGAIKDAVGQFFDELKTLHHDILEVWDNERDAISEVEVTYTRKDGKVISLPAAVIARRNDGGLFSDYRIYMDVNPLFA